MKLLLRVLILLCVFTPFLSGAANAAEPFDHSTFDALLKRFVNDRALVDYAAIKADPAQLNSYVAQIAARSPDSHPQDFPTREAQLAYWINAYNALVIHGVAEKWPTKSVRDLGFLFGFFRNKKFTVGGRQMTLDNIEHDTIRKHFADPRIHFAVNCAAISCPRLGRDAYTAENLERLLNAAARSFFNDPAYFRIDRGANRVTTSKILDWYGVDFEKYVSVKQPGVRGNAILVYARNYLRDDARRTLEAMQNPRVVFFDYDWGINSSMPPQR